MQTMNHSHTQLLPVKFTAVFFMLEPSVVVFFSDVVRIFFL